MPRYVNDDVERQWTSHKPDGKDTISWEEYRYCKVKSLFNSSVLFSGKMSMGSLMKKMLRRKNMDSLISRWKHVTKGAGLWPILTTVESSTSRYLTQA